LASAQDKMVVSAAAYRRISSIAQYAAGLFILIFVRVFLVRVIDEYRRRKKEAGDATSTTERY
jgi:hypothetical protein